MPRKPILVIPFILKLHFDSPPITNLEVLQDYSPHTLIIFGSWGPSLGHTNVIRTAHHEVRSSYDGVLSTVYNIRDSPLRVSEVAGLLLELTKS